jgi:hypothetical protein
MNNFFLWYTLLLFVVRARLYLTQLLVLTSLSSSQNQFAGKNSDDSAKIDFKTKHFLPCIF